MGADKGALLALGRDCGPVRPCTRSPGRTRARSVSEGRFDGTTPGLDDRASGSRFQEGPS
jgi:hypothetical protein